MKSRNERRAAQRRVARHEGHGRPSWIRPENRHLAMAWMLDAAMRIGK